MRLAKTVVEAREKLAVDLFRQGKTTEEVNQALADAYNGVKMSLPRLAELKEKGAEAAKLVGTQTTKIVLSNADFDNLVKVVENSPAPAPELVKLMRTAKPMEIDLYSSEVQEVVKKHVEAGGKPWGPFEI